MVHVNKDKREHGLEAHNSGARDEAGGRQREENEEVSVVDNATPEREKRRRSPRGEALEKQEPIGLNGV